MQSWFRSSPRIEMGRASRQNRRRLPQKSFSRPNFRFGGIEALEKRVLLAADLAVTETSNIGAAAQGQLIDYTISVQNVGDATATASTLTDTLPAGLTLVSASTDTGSVSVAGATITGNLGALAAGGTATLHVLASADTGTTGPVTNNVSVSSPDDSNAANDTASAVVNVSAAGAGAADLAVTKTASPTTATPGQLVTYTLTVTNNSATNAATNVQLGDMLPPGATFVDATSSQGTLSDNNGALNASLGTLAAGGSATVTVQVIPTAAGTLNNTTVATTDSGDSSTVNNSDSATVTVNAVGAGAVDLSVTKTDAPDPVATGQALTYTVTVTNNSATNAAADTTLTDALPAGVTFVSATSSQGTVSQTGGVITGALGSLAAGASATVTITVLPNVPGTITNTATASTSSGDSSLANNTATASTTVTAAGAGAVDLSVTKTDSPDPVAAGQALTYTVTVTNNSATNAAANTVLTDALPAGVTFVSATSSQGTVSQTGGVITGSLGSLAAGASATVTITVLPNVPGTITNTATASTSSGDNNLANNTATADTTVTAAGAGAVDLSVTKTDSPDPVAAGQALTYTVTVTNNSATNAATDTTLTDALPAGVTFVSATSSQGTVSQTGGVITGALGSLAAGASATVTITVLPNVPGTITNTATASTSSGDNNLANNTATADTAVTAAGAGAVDLSVTKTDSPDPVAAGQALTYTVTVTNNSATNAAADTTLTDALPAGVTFVSATSSQGTVSQTGGVITGALGSLAAGASATVTITVLPNVPGTITNTATASTSSGDNNLANNTATADTTVTAAGAGAVDLSVTKTDSPDPVAAGQALTYTVTVTNNSATNAAANTVLNDALPAGVTFVSATSSQGTVSQTGGVITGSLGSLAAGASATVTITVLPNVPGTITNTATASTSSGDNNLANNTATADTTVTAAGAGAADLSVTKTDSPDPVTAGQTLTYTVTVTNNSATNAAANTVLTDALPAGVTFVSATSSQGTVSQTGGVITGTLGSLAAGASATVTITVLPNVPGTITNTATASTSSGDNNLANNTATADTTVTAAGAGAVDLSVTKTDAPDPVAVGQNLTYTVTVTNNSATNAAADTVLTDALPAGVTFVSATSSQGTVSQTGGVITGTLGSLAAGASATITITVMPSTAGTITNTASASTSSGDNNLANNTATADTTVTAVGAGAVDLSVTKDDSPDPVTAGQNLTYTITVTNNSATNAAADTTVTDALPAGVTFVSASSSQGTVSQAGGLITGSLGSLAAGASATVTITVMPTAAGTVTNTATASTSSGDSNLANNTATATTTVTSAGAGAVDLSVTKTDAPDPVTAGQSLTYTITVTNNSATNAAADTLLTDTLPAGVTFVSATSSQGTVSQAGGVVTGTLGSLAAGATATVTIIVTPNSAGSITNTASASTSSGDTDLSNNTAVATTTVTASGSTAADLSVTKVASPDPDQVGQNLTYTITITNLSGANAAADTVLTDNLPAGVTFVSAASSQGSVSQSGGVVTGSLGTLAPGASATVTVVVTPNAAGTIFNTASVTTSTGDSDTTNNSTTIATTVGGPGGSGVGAGCYLAGQPGDGTDATFIRNMYHELLGREPDAAGQAFWLDFLNRDGNANHLANPRRHQMIDFFMASQEYREHLVNCMYDHFLNRDADAGGLQFFANQLANGVDEQVVLSEIVGSQEYFIRNGNTNQGFADGLYRDLLGRTPDSGGEAYWADRAATAGPVRDQVVRDMLNTTEAEHDLLINTSSSGLAQITGGGWENLYFQGNLGGAHDVFFDKLQARTPWDDVIEDMLETNRYYDSSKSI